jgi:hypothetical protein
MGGEALSKQSLTAHVWVTPTTCFCTIVLHKFKFLFHSGVIKIPTEILRIQLVLKGSGVADERLNIHFTILTGNLRIKK